MTIADGKCRRQRADDIVQRFIKERGDLFEEFHLFAREAPETVNLVRRTAGYVHFYENQTTPEQNLSGPMRELIATCQLCAKNDDRFAPNHVRRLYRMGVTNRVLFEAGEAIAPIVGLVHRRAHRARRSSRRTIPRIRMASCRPAASRRRSRRFRS